LLREKIRRSRKIGLRFSSFSHFKRPWYLLGVAVIVGIWVCEAKLSRNAYVHTPGEKERNIIHTTLKKLADLLLKWQMEAIFQFYNTWFLKQNLGIILFSSLSDIQKSFFVVEPPYALKGHKREWQVRNRPFKFRHFWTWNSFYVAFGLNLPSDFTFRGFFFAFIHSLTFCGSIKMIFLLSFYFYFFGTVLLLCRYFPANNNIVRVKVCS